MNRSREFIVIIICSVALAGLIMPVSADMISPAITHVYFEKGGAPYNGTVAFSVNCYGYYGWPASAIPNQSSPRGLVYHYSATCNGYGCPVYPTYYLQYTHIDWCDLEGTTDEGNFILHNFSSNPYGEKAVDIPVSVRSRTWMPGLPIMKTMNSGITITLLRNTPHVKARTLP